MNFGRKSNAEAVEKFLGEVSDQNFEAVTIVGIKGKQVVVASSDGVKCKGMMDALTAILQKAGGQLQ